MDSVRRRTEREGFDGDFYGRLAADVGAAHRVGGFIYDGRDGVILEGDVTRFHHRRFGADLDLRFASAGATIFGLYLWGDERGFREAEPSGGFVQVDKLATYRLLFTTRYSQVRTSGSDLPETRRSLALGAQAWLRERLRIVFEYRLQNGERPDEGVLRFELVL